MTDLITFETQLSCAISRIVSGAATEGAGHSLTFIWAILCYMAIVHAIIAFDSEILASIVAISTLFCQL